MYKLIYYPGQGWEKDFNTLEEVRVELLKHICKECLKGEMTYVNNVGGLTTEKVYDTPDPTEINDLFGTACGCEFGIEGPGYE